LSILRGGAGLGDPLERPYESVMEDIDGDFLLARYAEPVYGVVPGDPDATEAARAAARDRRGDEAVPVREWMAAERERVLAGDFIEPVRRMYAESLRLSQRWAAEFREFWDLPEDFDYDIDTPEVDIAKALIAQAGATA
jgi:N-methylhydantoinase B/acetone carboxylase alpha subunit